MRRSLAFSALLAVLLVAGAGIGPALGSLDSANRNDAESYGLTDLQTGGVQAEDAPTSVRMLDQGAVGVRHSPINPLEEDWTYLEPGSTVKSNEVTLYSTRFGNNLEDMDAQLVIVYWQAGEERVETENGTVTRRTVAEQQVERHNVTLETGYDKTDVSLRPHYDESYETTMWLEADGQRLNGTRWRFTHASSPASETVAVDSRSDLWFWAGQNILVIAIPGLLGTTLVGRRILTKTGKGPMKGPVWWGIVAALATLAITLFAYYKTAIMLARLPQLLGGLVVVIAFLAYLETADGEVSWVKFERPELTDAKSPSGEDVKDALKEDAEEHRAVRRSDGSLGLIKPGIRPFLARYFADPARLDDTDLDTQIDISGKWDKKYIADPDEGAVLDWTPAHWEFAPPLTEDVDIDAEAGTLERLLAPVNWSFVLKMGGALSLGYYGGRALFGLPSVGILVGLLAIVGMSYRAVDGRAEFTPAPIHLRSARSSLAYLNDEYDDAKTIEAFEELAWEEQSRTALEARAVSTRMDKTVTERMNEEELGFGDDEDSTDSSATEQRRRDRRHRPDPEDEDLVVADD